MIMFRLPVCPHCGTVYRYKETKSTVGIKRKKNICYHCKKEFTASLWPFVAIEALVLAAICVVINILILSRMRELSLIPLFAVTVSFILLIYLIFPFFIRFRKSGEETKTNNKTKSKNSAKNARKK